MPATVSLSRLAWRNLWRNRRRTLLNLFGISFGVLFAVVVTGLSDATYGDMIDYAAKMGVGHVSVEHEEYREAPSFEHVPRIDAAKIDTLRQDPRVTRITRRISGGTLAASSSGNQGASLMAIDPLAEGDETLLFLHDLKEGALFDTSEATTAAVGATLAENLGVRIGNKIVVTMTDKTGSVVSGMFRVGGLISTGAPSIDGGLVVTPLATTQALLGYDADEVTTVAIYLEDHRDAEAVARDLRVHLPAAAVALDWKRAQPDLAGFISMKESSGVIVQVLIMMMLAAGIFNTFFVSVMERRHEFGVLRAIGFSPGEVFQMITWESFWLGCVGLVAATLATAAPYLHLAEHGIDYSKVIQPGMEVSGVAMDPVMSVGIYPSHALIIAAVVFLATMGAGLVPAWRAAHTDPLEALRT